MKSKAVKLYIGQLDKILKKWKKKGWGNFRVELRHWYLEEEDVRIWAIMVSFYKGLLNGKMVEKSKGKVIPFYVSKNSKRENVQVFNAIKKLLKDNYE